MTSTLIVNARLVNEGREFDGDLRFADGRIEAIGDGLAAKPGEHVVDARQVVRGDLGGRGDPERDQHHRLAEPVEAARGLDPAEMDRESGGQQRHEGAEPRGRRERDAHRDREQDAQRSIHSRINR